MVAAAAANTAATATASTNAANINAVAMRGKSTAEIMAAFRSTGARQYAETLHGNDTGLIIVRVAPLRRPLGTFRESPKGDAKL